jgi:integrase
MPRAGKNLDVKTLDALKPRAKPYRVSDGEGLLLEVRPTGAKVWLCRLTVDGKRRDMGLGGYPLVTLKTAREEAENARRLARDGVDPIARRNTATAERKTARNAASEADARTFKAVALACIKAQSPGWKSGRTAALWEASLTSHAFPTLGDMSVAGVDRAAVLRAVEAVWTSRPATARKVLRRIGTVLRYAAAHGWRANDNPADARMLRHAGLSALPGGKNRPSLPWQRAPAFMKALDAIPGLAPLALKFCILTAVRSGEVRGARWSELSFDGAAGLWSIPGERMKGKKSTDVQPHRVPLSPVALDVLARTYAVTTGAEVKSSDLPRLVPLMGNALIFPTMKRDQPFSDTALSDVMRGMNETGIKGAPAPWRDLDGREAVPHGWRATFRTWVDDTRPEAAEAAEKALAHEDRNKVAGAYRRSDLLDRRIPLMAAWASHCEGTAAKTSRAGERRA